LDYIIGPSRNSSALKDESFAVVVEAKKEWSDGGTPMFQLIAQTAAISKNRIKQSKIADYTFGILTNNSLWRFIAVTKNQKVLFSERMSIESGRNCKGINSVLSWLTYIFKTMSRVSPTCSTDTLNTEAEIIIGMRDWKACETADYNFGMETMRIN
jgi:hypothetical protein